MAATDARPFPLKNTAYRVTFPLMDADGDLITGAAGLDSEVSKDGGTFADCTNEATEIATNSGMYFLDLSADEMNADTVAIIVKTSTSGAKTTPIVLYPAENTDIPVNVTAVSGDTAAADNLESYCDGTTPQPVDVTTWKGATAPANTGDAYARLGAPAGASVSADISAVKSDTGAIKAKTDNLPADPADDSDIDAQLASIAGYLDTEVAAILAAVDTEVAAIKAKTDNLPASPAATGDAMTLASGAITAAVVATGAIDADALAADAVDEILDEVVEGSLTLRQAIRLLLAVLVGKSAGGGTGTITFRDLADAKNRVSATVDGSGNRSAVTTDAT